MRNIFTKLINGEKKSFSKTPLNLLVVEDDESLVEVLNELFSELGYVSTVLDKTDDIVPLMEKVKPDLVLLDYLLPHINGGELCSQIKNHKLFSATPVIIFSAFSKVLISLGDYGCDAFIEKPFNLSELITKIERLSAIHSQRYKTE